MNGSAKHSLRSPLTLAGVALLASCAAAADFSGAAAMDATINQAVAGGLIPGAVVIVGHDGKILYRKAYGFRALVPAREQMTVDTIFDAASLTKVIATTSCVMKLFEEGKIRISEPVTKYLPDFQGGKSDITIRDLMTHFSGLRPDLTLDPPWSGYDIGIGKALADKPAGPPGVHFVYSDINFELMGEIVHRLSGETLDEYAREVVFEPLGMHDTMFKPPASLRPRIAPTEIDPDTGKPFRGVVHDPTSRYMGGVAGHAGMFTTADDLAKFANMMLGYGPHIFSPLTIRKFTSPETPPDQPILRGLGWDIDSPYSSNRGELFPIGSFGHTGFTGTSLWIDPSTKSFVILMTNSVHPHRGKNISPLRDRVATIAAAALGLDAPGVSLVGYNEAGGSRRMVEPNHEVQTGLDVLEAENFAPLRGKRIGLITNQTGVDRNGKRNVDAMLAAGVKVTALFSPEHGITGKEDRPDIADSKDPLSGLPVFSLYDHGHYQMTAQMLDGVNALVFDIQDAGARFYTYSCTLLYAVEQAGKTKLPIYVLDRPNPVTGAHVEGPLLDDNLRSFVGCYAMPIRHGMTFGELATMANKERDLNAKLHVIKMKDWQRGDWFDSTGLTWIDPSPNMRSLTAETLYDGVAMIEAAKNISVGRGTDAPFEQIGADWIRGEELAHYLNARQIPGLRVYATKFTPAASNFKGREIQGVRFVILNREQFNSVRLGLELAAALEKLYPGKLDLESCRFLIGNRKVLDELKSGQDPRAIEQNFQDDLKAFLEKRQPFLLY
ncbi:MAG TPA: exo-beta-N-acetylmuramidase NamZ domain-containing protein [Bryobacteraceae bacterium]|nr:exo-beta-N-acetylmuramidase NamZ domain-containing protein [Bryobacteraceae bacterium]